MGCEQETDQRFFVEARKAERKPAKILQELYSDKKKIEKEYLLIEEKIRFCQKLLEKKLCEEG